MSTPPVDSGGEKRKRPADAVGPRKKPAQQPQKPRISSLIGPHVAVISALEAKYDILVASVISSTQIRKRVELAVARLADADTLPRKPRVILLHARTAQVCKMITIVEQCKRLLSEEGKPWFQYNQLFDLPAEFDKPDVVEETLLDKDGEDRDDFEVMSSRFEKAVLPPPPARNIRSMRVFFSKQSIPELESKDEVTTQTSKGPELESKDTATTQTSKGPELESKDTATTQTSKGQEIEPTDDTTQTSKGAELEPKNDATAQAGGGPELEPTEDATTRTSKGPELEPKDDATTQTGQRVELEPEDDATTRTSKGPELESTDDTTMTSEGDKP